MVGALVPLLVMGDLTCHSFPDPRTWSCWIDYRFQPLESADLRVWGWVISVLCPGEDEIQCQVDKNRGLESHSVSWVPGLWL